MEVRNFKSVIRDMWRAKLPVGIFIIITTLLFAGHGYLKARAQTNEIASIENDEEYAQFMQEYEASLEDIKEATEDAVKLRDEEQEYVDNSIYMNLDSTKIYVANAQYSVSSNIAPSYNANIVNIYNSYIKEGGFVTHLTKEYDAASGSAIQEQYIKELVTVTPANPIFSVSVMCTDQDMAEGMLSAIDKVINDYKGQVEKAAASPFILEVISKDAILKTDPAVLNAQNTHLNNLKNYKNSVKDQRQIKGNTLNTMADYKERHMPEEVVYDSPRKALVKWAVFGAVVAFILPFAFYCLRYLLGGRLKDPDDLSASGIRVILRYKKFKGYGPEAQKTIMGLEYEALSNQSAVGDNARSRADNKTSNYPEIGIWSLSDTDDAKAAVDGLKKLINDIGSSLKIGDVAEMNDADTARIRRILDNKNVILIAETGHTEYRDIEEQMHLLKGAGVNIWGFIVIC